MEPVQSITLLQPELHATEVVLKQIREINGGMIGHVVTPAVILPDIPMITVWAVRLLHALQRSVTT